MRWSVKSGPDQVLTKTGLSRHAEYKSGYYDPNLRCVSSGPMRTYSDPYPIEIFQTAKRATVVYDQSIYGVRRINFSQEKHHIDQEPSANGESIGHWDGNTLVIETTNLSANVLTHNSEPISRNAWVKERWILEDDGALTMEATLSDPEYYAQPVIRRTQWVRDDNITFYGQVCDPSAFYEAISFEGKMKSHFTNKPQ